MGLGSDKNERIGDVDRGSPPRRLPSGRGNTYEKAGGFPPMPKPMQDYFDSIALERSISERTAPQFQIPPEQEMPRASPPPKAGLASLPGGHGTPHTPPHLPRKGYAGGGSIGDLSHAFEEVRSLPSEYLQKELKTPTGALPDWVIMGELHSRDALRKTGSGGSFIQPYTLKDQMLAGVRSAQPPSPGVPQFARGGLMDLIRPEQLATTPSARRAMSQIRDPQIVGRLAQELANAQSKNQPTPMAPMAPGAPTAPLHNSQFVPGPPDQLLPPLHYAGGGMVGGDVTQILENIKSNQDLARQSKVKNTDSLARRLANQPMNQPINMAQGGWLPDVDMMTGYIIERAPYYGIDPNTAVSVARTEGLRPGVWQSNLTMPSGTREPSYGPYQLYDKGLGAKFTQTTGLRASDPSTWREQIDFSLSEASRTGWTPWHGAKNNGIPQWAGINGNPTSYAAPAAAAGAGSSVDMAGGVQQMAEAAQTAGMLQQVSAGQASAANAAAQMMNPASPISGLAALMPALMMNMNQQHQGAPDTVHQQIPPAERWAGMEPLSPYTYSHTKPVDNTGFIV